MRFFINISILITCLLLGSCKKDFLDKSDPTRRSSEKFYSSDAEVNEAVAGVYSLLQSIVNNQWLFNEMISDNTTIDFNPSDRGQADRNEAFEFYTINASNVNNTQMYNQHYNAIFNINSALSKLNNDAISDDVKKSAEGQLKFLRAYFYFQLTQYYGDIILITEPVSDPIATFEYDRVPQAEVYAQIENDLRDAAAILPASYTGGDVGRVTEGAVKSLLGKVYLTEKKYSEAVTILSEVLSLGYSLQSDYASIFDPANKNNSESIFEVQYQGSSTLGEWSGFIYTFAPRLSAGSVTGFSQSNPGGWNIPTNDIIAAYETGDLRKAASIGLDYTRPSTGDIVPYIKKYNHAHAVLGRTDDNWPVLRYADVLLMLAEAINEQGEANSQAYSSINQVRQRAGLANLSGLSQSDFRTAVLKERRIELAFENWRWFDLKRTNTAAQLVQILNAHGLAERANPTVDRSGLPFSALDYVFADFEVLLPIPANETLVNTNLGQNTGY